MQGEKSDKTTKEGERSEEKYWAYAHGLLGKMSYLY